MALGFNGTTGFLGYDNFSDGGWVNDTPLTMAFLARLNVVNDQDMVVFRNPANDQVIAFRAQATSRFQVVIGRSIASLIYTSEDDTTPPLGTWVSLIMRYAGGQAGTAVNVYTNGVAAVERAPTNGEGTARPSDGPMFIADNGNATRFFNGDMANIAIWRRALNAEERNTLVATGSWALHVPRGLAFWNPGIRLTRDLVSGQLISSGLVSNVWPHPLTITQQDRRYQYSPSAAGPPPTDKRGVILGGNVINAMNVGNTAINRAYIGGTEIFN